MNRYLRGVTLGMALAGGLLVSAVAQHGLAQADGDQPAFTVDFSAIVAPVHSTTDNSTTNAVPSDFTPVLLDVGN